jgi:mannose-6-phosphate isomerase-like protein (cupin superfamily)
MPIRVYDYRRDLQNLVVRPEGRPRFRRVELGPVPPMHSHDLGVETFLVLEGEIEFNVENEAVVCTPGQLISVPPRTRHAVRAVGERTGAIFLSVAPHVEPTHTFYDEHGSCLPPRYGAWREAGGAEPSTRSADDHLRTYREDAERLLELAQTNARAVEALSLFTKKADADELWKCLSPLLEQVRRVERTWNALALVAQDLGAPDSGS